MADLRVRFHKRFLPSVVKGGVAVNNAGGGVVTASFSRKREKGYFCCAYTPGAVDGEAGAKSRPVDSA